MLGLRLDKWDVRSASEAPSASIGLGDFHLGCPLKNLGTWPKLLPWVLGTPPIASWARGTPDVLSRWARADVLPRRNRETTSLKISSNTRTPRPRGGRITLAAAVLAEVCWRLLSACYHGSPPEKFFFVFSQSSVFDHTLSAQPPLDPGYIQGVPHGPEQPILHACQHAREWVTAMMLRETLLVYQ